MSWVQLLDDCPLPRHDPDRTDNPGVGSIWICDRCKQRWYLARFSDTGPGTTRNFSWSRTST